MVGVSLCADVCSISSVDDTRYADVRGGVCVDVCASLREQVNAERDKNGRPECNDVVTALSEVLRCPGGSYGFDLVAVACSHGVELE